MSAAVVDEAVPGPRFAAAPWLLGLLLYLATLALCARAVTADGYDGVGFGLAVTDYDLSRWQPHPPGAPLYIAWARLVHALGARVEVALAAVSALLLGLGLGALVAALRRLPGGSGSRTGALAFSLAALGPLAWALAVATLSDGAGAGALLLAGAAVLRLASRGTRGLGAGGALLGLALAVRPQAAPVVALLLVSLLPGLGLRAALALCLGTGLGALLWLVPYALWLGPQRLGLLVHAHARGHFTDFGGGLAVDPHPIERGAALLGGLLEATLGPLWLLGLGLGGLALFVHPPRRWPLAARRAGRTLLLVGLGAALWAFAVLPVRGHGRHLLPAALALALALGLAVDQALGATLRPAPRRALLVGVVLLVAGLGLTSARTVRAFRTHPDPGAALGAYAAQSTASTSLVYGARAARHLDLHRGSGTARPALFLGEVLSDLSRLDRLPAEVLVTSEVRASARSQAALRPLARFCYDSSVPRLLRWDLYEGGCVTLSAYRVNP
ncbi:MAG: hypothetical protein U1A78_25275 [Polyangia bacterium]